MRSSHYKLLATLLFTASVAACVTTEPEVAVGDDSLATSSLQRANAESPDATCGDQVEDPGEQCCTT
ncbi:MAG: hypothetical protein ACTHU0_00615, partial [Kofleriaceae bacterium]